MKRCHICDATNVGNLSLSNVENISGTSRSYALVNNDYICSVCFENIYELGSTQEEKEFEELVNAFKQSC